MTKMTLKARQEALKEWAFKAPDILLPLLEARRPKIFSRSYFMKDGEAHFHCYCEKCGAEYDEKITPKTVEKCSHCGNFATLNHANEYNTFVQFDDNGWTAAHYCVNHQQDSTSLSEDPFAELKNPVLLSLRINHVLQYDKDSGFQLLTCRDWYGELKATKTGSATYKNVLYVIERSRNAFSVDKNNIDMQSLIEDAEMEFARKLAFQTPANKTKSQLDEELRAKYQPKSIDAAQIIQGVDDMLYLKYSDVGTTEIHKVACLNCNNVFLADLSESAVCPHCGKLHERKHKYDRDLQSYRLFVFENTDLPDEDLLIRVFTGSCRMTRLPDGNYRISRQATEGMRFFLGKKKYAYEQKDGAFVKARADLSPFAYDNSYMYELKTMHSKEELRDILANSYLRHSGVIEAMGLGNPAYKPVVEINELAYIKSWYANKGIEYIYKAQLRNLTYECMNYGTPKLFPGTSVKEVLGLSNLGLQIVRQCDLGLDDLEAVRTLCQCDPTLSIDGYRQMTESINPVEAAELAEKYGIRWKEMVDYIESVYMHQCIEKEEAVTVWRDYLSMAKDLGYALNEKSRKFPNSLRKEHDIVTFATNALAEAETKEEFLKQAQKNHDRYHFTYDKFMAIIPQSTEEVIQEATQQHNCLRSYIRSIQNGSTAVAFIRRKEQPEKSYVTVEIRDAQILQIQGFANTSPRCAELTEFLQYWTKAKKLKVSCMY